jgi:hypothetical protein
MCKRRKGEKLPDTPPDSPASVEDSTLPSSPSSKQSAESHVPRRPRRPRRQHESRCHNSHSGSHSPIGDPISAAIADLTLDASRSHSKPLQMGIGLARGPPLDKEFPPLPPTGPLPQPPVGVEPWRPPKGRQRRPKRSQ